MASTLAIDALYSFLRMLAAYGFSLVFAIAYGVTAGRSRRRTDTDSDPRHPAVRPGARVLPGRGLFLHRAHAGGRAGVEMAAVFLIFTGQAWNMASASTKR